MKLIKRTLERSIQKSPQSIKAVLAGQLLSRSFLAILLVNISCSTTTVKLESISAASWKSRILLKDTKRKKSQVLLAEILAVRPTRIRMDFSTSLGQQVAALVSDQNHFQMISLYQKSFVTGSLNSDKVLRYIPVRVNPELIISGLFEVEPTDAGWSCQRSGQGILMECLNPSSQSKIRWLNRENQRRTVVIEKVHYVVQFDLMNFRPNVQVEDSIFQLKPPDGFSIKKL